MKAYEGFDKNLKCRDFQCEVGKEYEEREADICICRFHACENPLDVFDYYPPADSRYCEVDLDANEQMDSDGRRVGKRIKITAEIGLLGLIKAGVEYIKDQVEWENAKESNTRSRSAATNTGLQSVSMNTGDRSAATNTGLQSVATNTGLQSVAMNTACWSAATNTGLQSVATNTGLQSVATNAGDRSVAMNTGDRSAATNTGLQSVATNTGLQSAATNTGLQSVSMNTGNQSVATNTGDRSVAIVTGYESVAIATGYEGRVKGSLGCFLVLAEWKEIDGEYHIVDVKSAKVDGESIKPDTFYTLKDGEFVETE